MKSSLIFILIVQIFLLSCTSNDEGSIRPIFTVKELLLMRDIISKGLITKMQFKYFNNSPLVSATEMDYFLSAKVELILLSLLIKERLYKKIKNEVGLLSVGYCGVTIETLKRLRKNYLMSKKSVDEMHKFYFGHTLEQKKYLWVDEMILKFSKNFVKKNYQKIVILLLNQKYFKIIPGYERKMDKYFISLMKYLRYHYEYYKDLLVYIQSDKRHSVAKSKIELFIEILQKVSKRMYHRHFNISVYSIERYKTLYKKIKMPRMKKYIRNINAIEDIFDIMRYISVKSK